MKNTALMVVVLLVVMGGGVYLYQKQKKTSMMNPSNQYNQPNQSTSATSPNSTTSPQVNVSEGLTLDVSKPKDGDTLSESFVTVDGKTAANASVSVNDSDLKADAQGNFSTKVDLDEGENIINVTANDDKGNYAEKELTVTMQGE